MASKEAILVLLDMGSEMLKRFHKESESISDSNNDSQRRIDVAVNCVKLMLQQKMFNSKTSEVGLILFGLKESGNDKIMYIRGLGRPDTDFLKNVLELKNFESEEVKGGDIFEALDQTIETMNDYVGTKKYDKRIFLMTTGAGRTNFKEAQIKDLVANARRVAVKINVIGFDFMMTYNPHSADSSAELVKLQENDRTQTATQNMNQKLFVALKQELGETLQFFPSHIAMEIYEQFRSRQVNVRSKFNGELAIAPGLQISVQMFTKTTEEKLPGLKAYSLAVDFTAETGTALITKDINHCIQEDPNMVPIDKANIIKAYHYGKQLIPISDVLSKQMAYESIRELKVLGFVDQKRIPRQSFMSGVDILIANQSNALAKKGLAALANAMKSLNKYAVVRYVWRANGTPKLCALVPQVGKDHECLYMVQIPTSESVRDFQFNSLKESTKQQQDLMGKLIDKMDLMGSQEDDESESLEMKYTFNPTRQYFYQTVFHRVFNPPKPDGTAAENAIPPLEKNINDYIHPEKKICEKVAAELAAIKDLFKLEEIEIRDEVTKKIYWQQLFNPAFVPPTAAAAAAAAAQVQIKMENNAMETEENRNLDEIVIVGAQEDLEEIAVTKKFAFDEDKKDDVIRNISTVSPVDDFFQMLTNRKEDLVADSVAQMQSVIEQFIEISIRGSFFEKAIDCLKALRRGCTSEYEEMEAPQFNKFLFKIKDKCLKSDQKQFWRLVIERGITLITTQESKKSPITTKEAVQFLDMEEEVIQNIPVARKQNDDFDIMDELE